MHLDDADESLLRQNAIITVSHKQTVETELIDICQRKPNIKYVMAKTVDQLNSLPAFNLTFDFFYIKCRCRSNCLVYL